MATRKRTAVDRRIRIGGQLVAYDDATEEVTLERILADILKAKPGDAENCMNSMCIKAQRNRRIFPHNVWAVSTIKSRVYIVDEIGLAGDNVVFKHAIRYELPERESKLIHEHDTTGSGEPGKLNLKIPLDPKGSPRRQKNAEKSGGKRFANGAGHGSNSGGVSTGARDLPVTAGVTGETPAKTPPKARTPVRRKRSGPAGVKGAKQRYKVAVGALSV